MNGNLFVRNVKHTMPELLNKPKVYLILHLVDCMEKFGPCSAFCAEIEVCSYFLFLKAIAIFAGANPSIQLLEHRIFSVTILHPVGIFAIIFQCTSIYRVYIC